MFKNKRNFKKASAMVEFLVIIPAIIVFLFATWHIYEMSSNKIKIINVARYLAWSKVDYTGGEGGTDPYSNNQIISDAKDFYKLKDANIDQINIISNQSLEPWSTDALLYESATGLQLSVGGIWGGEISYKVPSVYSNVINNLIPDNAVANSFTISEKCYLLTDAWNASNQGNDKMEGQVRERIKGYWVPLSMVPFLDGDVVSALWDILDFKIELPWPFGTYYLCEEQPPRVNLESVPDRT